MTKHRRMRPLLGTFVEVAADDTAQRSLSIAFAALETLHTLLSFHDRHSDLSRLNRAAGEEVTLHPLSIRVLQLARAMTRMSGGLFNCTVGGALVRCGALPDHGGPAPLDYGDAGDLALRGNRAKLLRPVRITLDGIAKGYAVDHAIMAMKRCGVCAGWINAGGDLRVFGDITLPVQRRELDGVYTSLGWLQNSALATSRVDDRHDPRFPGVIVAGGKGRPTQGLWSVQAKRAWRADALTKVAGLAGQGERTALIERLGGRLLSTQDV